GGVLAGMSREMSYQFTKGLFKSFAALDDKPADIKDSVMSPAGTTAEGYKILEENRVRSAFINAIKGAYEKSQKI
ncbi:MAG: pyrroline-5-carboxylate reductase, partial [Nautilia sp.]